MPESEKAISISVSKDVKRLLAGMLIGLALGIAGTVFVVNFNPPDAPESDPTVVFGRIAERNELVSVSQDYSIVDKSTDVNRLFDFVDVPFTDNSFWYRYAGTIRAGVNMETADISMRDESTIVVSLNEPYVIANTPDMEKTGVLEERNNVLNPIHIEDVDAFQQECVSRSEDEALAGGLLDEARANAEDNIRGVFYAAFGDEYAVEFNWKESAENTEANTL